MTTHSNYSLQNFGTSNTRVLTGISQPVSEIKLGSVNIEMVVEPLKEPNTKQNGAN